MARYYFNDMPIVAPLSIESDTGIESSDFASLRRLQLGITAQRWKMSFHLGPTEEIKNHLRASVLAFTSTGCTHYQVDVPQPNDFLPALNLQGGSTSTSTSAAGLTITPAPLAADETAPDNTVTFSVTAATNTTTTTTSNYVPANVTSGAINTSINTMTVSEGIPAGRFIRFSGHSKVYLVIESDVERHTVGTPSNIKIYPQLLSTVQANEQVYFGTDVEMTVCYDKSTLRGVTYIDGILADAGEVRVVEVPPMTTAAVTTLTSATATTMTSATDTTVNAPVTFTIT